MSEQATFSLEQSEGQAFNQTEVDSSSRFQDEVGDSLFQSNSVQDNSGNDSVSQLFGDLEIQDLNQESQENIESPESLKEHIQESATLHRIKVEAGGREMDSTILLPDNYDANIDYPVVVGLHSFPGDGDGMGELIEAERLTENGVIVVLPSAESGMWESNAVDGISYFSNPFSEGHDDIAGIKETLSVVNEMYGTDERNINYVAHGQAVPVATELARQLDEEQPGAAKRLFLTAGSMVNTDDSSISLPGTDVVHYEPESDWIQDIGNFMTRGDDSEEFLPKITQNKGCQLDSDSTEGNVTSKQYSCSDGSSVLSLFEKDGEMAYPGQPERFDGMFGAGSTSEVDMTQMVIDMIQSGKVSRLP